ncbi:permease prefix domain 1-containing protein [Bacillus sp. 31A1R]|uniref:Permease prefix domain 1-containing protein n=1 Tax=Robertmurraya mangrovi TaxID=3098077 RepID=A0ABU5J0P4_9BACI|nr:permease prefix domain 1-containing protein [Bacillus sp. 31A1R]MDZ5472927.1 permease prefix domain 1-containing protein [Bacillus sp. 31A1R]
MSKQERIEPFEQYIKKLVLNLDLDKEEKLELEEEWKQHLYDHFAALQKQDINREEAIKTVLEQFGEMEMLQTEVNQTYPSSIKNHVQKELVIAIICLIASMIGPSLLINARFQIYFILAPIQALIVAYLLYRFVIKKQSYWFISIIGFVCIYFFFLQTFANIFHDPLTYQLYWSQLFSLDWNQLTGMNGLFEFETIHMMWYVVIAMQFLTNNGYIPVWKRVCNATFQYWAMLLIGFLLAGFQSSGQWSILYLNVFLLYSFLQQTLSIRAFLLVKEKVSRRLTREYF